MRTWRGAVVSGAFAVLAVLVPAGPAPAAPTWAPAATAPIHPGVQTMTAGGQCTSNFVFYDGAKVFIGQAAHCSGTGGATDTDGCLAGSLDLGTPVEVDGASQAATMVYNSWLTMQARGETDADACQYNDLALVQLHPADAAKVNPSIPHWGGPNGLNTTGTTENQKVYSYGNSSLRLGLTVLSPKVGWSHGDNGGGWSHSVFTVTPGIPGDSGSAFLDSTGKALGVLSTLNVAVPGGVTNGVGNLQRELDYLRTVPGFADVQLALGTTAFNGRPVRLGL